MGDLQRYYNMIAYGGEESPPPWINEDPKSCGCRGRGWYNSQLDTWHSCPVHFNGQTHPDMKEGY